MALSICQLIEFDRAQMLQLYRAMTTEARFRRFGYFLSEDLMARYVSEVNLANGTVLGAFDGDRLVGVCEAVPCDETGSVRELAFVVAAAYQGHGIGRQLGQAMMRSEAGHWVVACMSDNPPMSQLARNLGFTRVESGVNVGLPAGLLAAYDTPHGLFVGHSAALA